MRRLITLLLGAAIAVTTAHAASKPATKPAMEHGATAMADAPFWTGHPDAATFAKVNKERLARAKAAIDKVLAVKGARTLENTLRPYDDALLELDAAGAQSSLLSNV